MANGNGKKRTRVSAAKKPRTLTDLKIERGEITPGGAPRRDGKPGLRKKRPPKGGGPGQGVGGGRPSTHTSYDPETAMGQRESARAKGAGELEANVELWTRLRNLGLRYVRAGKFIPERIERQVLESARELSNRCGLPVLSEMSVRSTTPAKLINEGKGPGWFDDAGEFHAIEVEPGAEVAQ